MTTQNDTCIKAMPTEYKGIQMKSRFEAQAAFLFDCLGWEWKYESGSYMLPNGVAYLPDFLIEDRGLFVECRGYESDKGESQISGFASLVSAGIENDNWGTIEEYLVLRGDSEASLYSHGKHCGMVFLIHCKKCGWRLTSLHDGCYGMDLAQVFCPCCIAPLSSSCWGKWDGRARIDAAAIITVAKGKILVNGAGAQHWQWIIDLRSGEAESN